MSIEPDVAPSSMGSVPYDPPNANRTTSVSGQMSGDSGARSRRQSSSRSSAVFEKLYDLYDVDTSDVVERCGLALNPLLRVPFLTNGLLDSEHANTTQGTIVHGKRPDIWGPIWIYFTLVFAVFFSATMPIVFDEAFATQYDIGLLTGTAVTLFAFTFVFPVLAWLIIQYFNLVPSLTLMQTICLYGYSCTVWIPAVLIAGSPLGTQAIVGKVASLVVRCVSIGIAFLFSAQFIYGNLYKVMASQASQAVTVDKTKMAMVLVAGIVVHAALAITLLFF